MHEYFDVAITAAENGWIVVWTETDGEPPVIQSRHQLIFSTLSDALKCIKQRCEAIQKGGSDDRHS